MHGDTGRSGGAPCILGGAGLGQPRGTDLVKRSSEIWTDGGHL